MQYNKGIRSFHSKALNIFFLILKISYKLIYWQFCNVLLHTCIHKIVLVVILKNQIHDHSNRLGEEKTQLIEESLVDFFIFKFTDYFKSIKEIKTNIIVTN